MSEPAEFDVGYVAQLARIDLSPEEKRLFQQQLKDVLAYINKLKEADVAGITLADVDVAAANVDREDVPRDWFTSDEALRNAPHQANNLFIVPKVVE